MKPYQTGSIPSTPRAHALAEPLIKTLPPLEVKSEGDIDSMEFRVKTIDLSGKGHISLWHDIALYPNSESKQQRIVNMVNEVKYFNIRLNEKY